LCYRAFREWRSSGQHVIPHSAQRVDVTLLVYKGIVANLLRRLVAIRRLSPVLDESEVNQLEVFLLLLGGNHEVRWKNASRNDTVLVNMIYGPSGLGDEVEGLSIVELTSLFNIIFERDAIDEFHGDIQDVGATSKAIEPGDVLVVEPPAITPFGAE